MRRTSDRAGCRICKRDAPAHHYTPVPMSETTLTRGTAILQSSGLFDDEVLRRFTRFLAHASDDALFRMSPLRYARAHGLCDREAIDL